MKVALEYASFLIEQRVKPGETVIDATCGNGHDTTFLARLVGEGGSVFAFDVQEEAIQNTRTRLSQEGLLSRVNLINDNHDRLGSYIDSPISCCMFNLGYLPGGDHDIITRPDFTIPAVEQAASLLTPGGIITIICYRGHQGGQEEYKTLHIFCQQLQQNLFTVLEYKFINQANYPPLLLAIEKR